MEPMEGIIEGGMDGIIKERMGRILKGRMGRIIKGRMEGKRIRGRPRWMVLD